MFCALFVQLLSTYSASASDKSVPITITSPPTAPSLSKQLGVQAAPISVEIDGVGQEGLFILSDPNKPLGKAMKLRQNLLLLTLDGYAVKNVADVDSYLERRAKNKPLAFSYVPLMSGGSGEGQVHSAKCEMTPAASSGRTSMPKTSK